MNEVGKKTSEKITELENETQKVKSKEKRKKSKEKIERPIVFAARARLEPRLKLPSSKKSKGKQNNIANIEKDKRLIVSLNANEIEEHLKSNYLKEDSHLNSHSATGYVNKTKDAASISPLKNKNNGSSLKDMVNDFGDEEDFINFLKQSKQNVSKGKYWTDIEIKDLAYALQTHGFADMKKIADEVKTKTENDIKFFVRKRVLERRRDKTLNFDHDKHRGRPRNSWTTVSHENLETWPTIRKWKRLAYEQMLLYTRTKDYSRPVISALCNKFYEEEPEPDDSQVINVKLIYKYISDCMIGAIPPQLPPKESALVLDLLREVQLMPITYDFEEEKQFLKDFRSATTFKPFQLKDEFKTKFKHAHEEMNDPNAVSVPEEVFLELSRHKRSLQSFTPLITPVWMIQKEQEYLESYFKETNVYID